MFCPAAQELRLQKKLLPTMSICEERVLKYGPPGTKAILKIQKFNIKNQKLNY